MFVQEREHSPIYKTRQCQFNKILLSFAVICKGLIKNHLDSYYEQRCFIDLKAVI